MATYHVTTVPRAGKTPHPATCPLIPCDITADSEGVAVAYMAEDWLSDIDPENDDQVRAYIAQWQPVARRVDRPTIDLKPRAKIIEPWNGQLYDYGEETGTETFDVLVDGHACGRLERQEVAPGGQREWLIADARAPLAALADRRWVDRSPAGSGKHRTGSRRCLPISARPWKPGDNLVRRTHDRQPRVGSWSGRQDLLAVTLRRGGRADPVRIDARP